MLKKITSFIRHDPVLFAAMVLAVVSAFFVPPSAGYFGYIDYRVLCLLLSLMLVVAGLKKAGVFDFLVRKLLSMVGSTRALAAVLTGVCFFTSMLITNDVALITFVPLAVMTLRQSGNSKLLIPVIVLQTVAANLGSMLTPLGNPQNLYIYALSGMSAGKFLGTMAVPTALSFLLLAASMLLIKSEKIEIDPDSLPQTSGLKKAVPWAVLFVLCILTVCHMVHFAIALAVVVIAVLILDRTLLPKADYGLLLTFVFFFIFIGNIKALPAVSNALASLVAGREMTVGILLSQVISNVPASMLLSGFATDFSALLLGVNLGGLGTLIASMASVISYKLYAAEDDARPGKYIGIFTAVNVIMLAVLWPVMWLIY